MTHYRPLKSSSMYSSSSSTQLTADSLSQSTDTQSIANPEYPTGNNPISYPHFFKEKVDLESANHEYFSATDAPTIASHPNNGYTRPVIIFGAIDLSKLSPLLQYVILSLGLLIFMCLYGYYQELVAYNYFDRKLTMFSTFLHFLGCYIVAHGQRQSIYTSGTKHYIGSVMSMGTAPHRIGVFYYILLILLKTISQGLTNLSMTQINYPAKVLFKSASPIINMIIGLVWFRRSYIWRDYVVVLLLVMGLYVFVNGDANGSPEGTKFGIILVTVAMFCGAAVPMVQEHCINKYHATVEELLYHSFLGSTIISFILSIISGELSDGIHFITIHGNIYVYSSLILFSVVGFCGSNFSTGLTLRFGSLVNGITNTARKAVTLGLSFALFPSRNHLTYQHIYGAVIFFSGLIVRTMTKGSNESSVRSSSAPESSKISSYEDVSQSSQSILASEIPSYDTKNVPINPNGISKYVSNSLDPRNVHIHNNWNMNTNQEIIGINHKSDSRDNINKLTMRQEEEDDDMDVEIGPILTANSNNTSTAFRV